MAGAIIQLVAYGIQDMYLTSDPQITFFKMIYRRHTNFSVESVIQNFSEAANFGESVTCTLSRVGDMVEQMFLYVDIPSVQPFVNTINGENDRIKKFAWVRGLGLALIQEVTAEIGGKLIDRQYGEWLYIWAQMTSHSDNGYSKLVGNIPEMYNFSNGKAGYQLYIPLDFWFCRSPGVAIPLIALASSDVKIKIKFRKLEECIRVGPTHSIELLDDVVPFEEGDYIEQTINGNIIRGYVINYDYLQKKLYYIKIQNTNASKQQFTSLQEASSSGIVNNTSYQNNIPFRIYDSITRAYVVPKPNVFEEVENTSFIFKPRFVDSYLYVNYIYLDTDERLKFARSNHEYLIEQLQFNQDVSVRSPNLGHNLALNHPCRAHYWVVQLDSIVGAGTINDLFNFSTSPVRQRDGTLVGQNLVTRANLLLNGRRRFNDRDGKHFNLTQPYQSHFRGPAIGVNMYSFALHADNYQPSATCNMSKIDYIRMDMQLDNTVSTQNTCKVRSYTVNYNILRIFFNLGGLAFV
jgi:hypothetical protein